MIPVLARQGRLGEAEALLKQVPIGTT